MRNQGRYSGDNQDRFGGGHFGRDHEEDNHRNGYRNQRRDDEGRFMNDQRAGWRGRDEEGRFTSGRWGNGSGYFGDWAGQREIAQFDEDYKYWRQEQISKLDEDYATWLSERRQKFADEFDKWRSERRKGGIHNGAEKKQ